jgi:hypothetical protein
MYATLALLVLAGQPAGGPDPETFLVCHRDSPQAPGAAYRHAPLWQSSPAWRPAPPLPAWQPTQTWNPAVVWVAPLMSRPMTQPQWRPVMPGPGAGPFFYRGAGGGGGGGGT